MEVQSLTVGLFASNCHLLLPDGSDSLIVIDPGDEADRILESIAETGRAVAGYLITHGHVDHVSALAEVARRHPAPIAMHPKDAAWAFTARNSMPPFYDTPAAPPPISVMLADGFRGDVAGCRYEVLETPGHSPGSVSLLFPDEGMLFSGDVLFAGAIGRTDLPGGNAQVLLDSLRKLTALPPGTRVFPGHGGETTIGDERRENPFLLDTRWARGRD